MRRRIHRGPPGGLAECQTCRSVDKHSEDIREPGLRRGNCLPCRYPRSYSRYLSRSGKRRQKLPRGYAAGSNPSWTGRPFAAIGLARIPHAGRDTWIICCPNDPKCNASNIILHCRTRMPLRSFKRCEPNPATRKGFGLPHPDRDPYQRNDWRSMERDRSVGWHLDNPAERMKAGKEHRVPLSKAALELLHEARTEHAASDDYVFVGQKAGRPLSNMAFLQLLKRMNRGDITAHGFRSTFRDWVGEVTHHAREIAEAALAHTIKDKSEAAYARGDLFLKRRSMMEDWADFLAQQTVSN